MKVTRWACVAVTSAMFGCGGGGGDGGTTNPPPPPPPGGTQTLGSISTNVTSMNLVAGNTQTITVSAFDTQGGAILSFTPVFTATGTNAEVDNGGTVLGLTAGATTINVAVTLGAVTRTASVAVTVTGALPSQANVSTQSGDIFTPNKVAISQGGQVTWTFAATEHTVVFSAPGAPGGITSGGYSSSHSRTFGQTGNFSYVCTIHAGMNGQVIVR